MEKILSLLITRNIDCSKTYNLAAEDVENENLRNFLRAYAARREAYAIELSVALKKISIVPDPPVSLISSALLRYMKLRGSLSGWKDHTILKVCARNEARALSTYETAIEISSLPPEIRSIISRHRDKILDAEQILQGMNSIIERRKFELQKRTVQ